MPPLPRIHVHPNQRFLQTEHGAPFFWLGDTAWELFHRLRREQAQAYFANRQEKRFTVIQAVILAEFDGLNTSNMYGEKPLVDNDPTRPSEAYFAYVDDLVHMAAAHDLYMALLPTWADKVTPMWGVGPAVFNEHNARVYGRFLGRRYGGLSNVLWVLGGDRPAEHLGADFRPIWRAMAEGIRESAPQTFMTYHPMGGFSSSQWVHHETWLDMNMMQSGHGGGHDVPCWEMIAADLALQPPKPTLDGEPNYEDHPVSPWPTWDPVNGHYTDYDVRKQLYRSVFAGGCGVTYGHHSVWQMWMPAFEPINHPLMHLEEALDRPGAFQLRHLRALMESRPYFSRLPAQEMLASNPSEKGEHVEATRDANGSYALVYFPLSRSITLKLDGFAGSKLSTAWYDPRTSVSTPIGVYPARGMQTFTPPAQGPDWVLMLDVE
jgi:hypothetical protein